MGALIQAIFNLLGGVAVLATLITLASVAWRGHAGQPRATA